MYIKYEIIEVNRKENWIYLVKYSDDGVNCTNDQLKLDEFEKKCNIKLVDGKYDFLIVYALDKNFKDSTGVLDTIKKDIEVLGVDDKTLGSIDYSTTIGEIVNIIKYSGQ